MAQFATAADLAEFLGEAPFSGTRLAQATSALEVASAAIQAWTRQTLELVADDQVILRGTSDVELELPQRPVVEATVTAIDGVAPVAGSYRLVGDILVRPGGWRGLGIVSANGPDWSPYDASSVFVTYSHGFETIPDDVRAACLQMAARGLQGPPGVRQESIGTYSVTYAAGEAGAAVTAAEEDLLGRYRQRARSAKLG